VTAEIQEGRKATVFVLVALMGLGLNDDLSSPCSVLRECVVRMKWRRRKIDGAVGSVGSRWICERMVSDSAAGGFIGLH